MTRLARALFAMVLGPLLISALTARPILPENFHGCYRVLGRYPKNLPLMHRAIYSWWIMPMNVYREAARENKRKLML